MPAEIITKGLDKVLRGMSKAESNYRYALSQAINDTAKDVQKFTVTDLLPNSLTLRSKGTPWQRPGNRFGFNIRPFANKLRLFATVGSQADWLREVEEGGTKKGRGGGLAIPTSQYKPKEQLMSAARKPRAILAKKKAFLYRGEDMPAGIYARTSKARLPIEALFIFKRESKVPALLHFERKAKEFADRVFQIHFAARIAQVLSELK